MRGAISVGTTDPERAFGRAELDSLRRLADLGSVALEQAEMRKHLELAVGSGVEALTEAIDMRDHYTWQHSQNVMELAGKLGKRMELDEAALAELAFAARLHDVGKVGVPDAVLLKAGPLNEDEWEIMKQYPLRGAEMLERVPGLGNVAQLSKMQLNQVRQRQGRIAASSSPPIRRTRPGSKAASTQPSGFKCPKPVRITPLTAPK